MTLYPYTAIIIGMKAGQGINKAESAEYRILPGIPGIRILKAFYRKHHFKTHAHAGYTLGMIINGAGGFRYKGREQVTCPGHVTLLDPFEPHAGHVIGETGWRYNTLYISPGYVSETAADLLGNRPAQIRFGRDAALSDPEIFKLLSAFHAKLRHDDALLESESILQLIISKLLARYAERKGRLPNIRHESRRVNRLLDYIRSHFRDKIMLSELAELTGLSKFQVIRMFRKSKGLSPHEYQNQLRIREVCRLLNRKVHMAEAALDTGFYDQSHMSKCFKSIIGVTPGKYMDACNILQDASQ